MASDSPIDSLLSRIIQALQDAGVPYMLTGSFASSLHGSPRVTQDVDIVIAPNLGSLQKLLGHFPEDAYYVSRDAARDVASILSIRGTDLDLDYINRWVKQLDITDQWSKAKSLLP